MGLSTHGLSDYICPGVASALGPPSRLLLAGKTWLTKIL